MGERWKTIGAGLWVGEYRFHGNDINMLVTELGEGQLAVFSPGPGVDDASFAELNGLGKVVAIVSPGAFHNEGLRHWHGEYPQAKLYATKSGIPRIAKLYPDLPPCADAAELAGLSSGALTVYETPGKHGDLLVFVSRGDTTTVFSCEYLINWTEGPKKLLFRLMFQWTNSAPGLRMAKPSAWFLGAKLPDVGRFCLDKVATHGASCFVPCHGAVVQGPETKSQLEQAIRARL